MVFPIVIVDELEKEDVYRSAAGTDVVMFGIRDCQNAMLVLAVKSYYDDGHFILIDADACER